MKKILSLLSILFITLCASAQVYVWHNGVVIDELDMLEIDSVTFAKPQPTYEYVDLGLPSGTLWATCNIGAENPGDYGYYFAWAETTTKDVYDMNTYPSNIFFKYELPQMLKSEDDAATVNWGENWRMPTVAEFEELIEVCDWKLSKDKGQYTLVGPNGKTMILPMAGFKFEDSLELVGEEGRYWSSQGEGYGMAKPLYITEGDGIFVYEGDDCWNGFSIRPVYKK